MERGFCPNGPERARITGEIPAFVRFGRAYMRWTRNPRLRYDFRLIFHVCNRLPLSMVKNPSSASAAPKTFESALAELDDLVEKMENGQLPLEESLSAYQRGTELLKFCDGVLKEAEQKIKVLDGGELKDLPA